MNPLKAIKKAFVAELDRHTVYELPATFMVDDIKAGHGNTVVVKTQLSAIHKGAKPKTVEFALEVSPKQLDELMIAKKARRLVRVKTGLSKIFQSAAKTENDNGCEVEFSVQLAGGRQLITGADLDPNNATGTKKIKADVRDVVIYNHMIHNDVYKINNYIIDNKINNKTIGHNIVPLNLNERKYEQPFNIINRKNNI